MSSSSIRFVCEVWFCRNPPWESAFCFPGDGFSVYENIGFAPDDVDTFVIGATLTPPVIPRKDRRESDE